MATSTLELRDAELPVLFSCPQHASLQATQPPSPALRSFLLRVRHALGANLPLAFCSPSAETCWLLLVPDTHSCYSGVCMDQWLPRHHGLSFRALLV